MPRPGGRGRRARPVLGLLLAATLLAACTGLASRPPAADAPSALLAKIRAAGLPGQADLDAVAFHRQADFQCGPAALAMAFSAAGVAAMPEVLAQQVFIPARRGTLQPEMLAATRRAGLLPYLLPGELPALLAEVAAGHPVIVLQDLGSAWQRRWHYAVLVGYDLARSEVILRSGDVRRLRMSFADFTRSWLPGGRWGLLALAPGTQPADADPERYLRAASALERVRPAEAEAAYRSALHRWPDHSAAYLAQLGLGNAAHAQGRHDDAAAAFRAAVALQPLAADAWNNLAQVLHEQGQARDAEVAARRAVDIGGPRATTYAATLAELLGQAPGTSALQRGNSRHGHDLD